MTELPSWHDIGHDITCIDAGYVRHGFASFYLVRGGDEYAAIETGTRYSMANLERLLAERGIGDDQVRYVIPTHVHLDHAGGAGVMMARFPNATLLIHPRGARHMVDPAQLVAGAMAVYGETAFRELYGEVLPVEAGRVREVADGETVQLGGRELLFRHTDGHARHHFCVWDAVSSGWFSGDMFGVCYPWFRFAAGNFVLPSTTPTQFDPAAYLESLALLAAPRPKRIYLTHYGAIDYDSATSARLAEQVSAYRDLAVSRQGDLTAALSDYALSQLARFADHTSEAQLREWVATDVGLNAQGLAIWRDRRQRETVSR